MVVIFLPTASEARVWQDFTAWPSSRTVQAPHSPSPQPYFVPVRLRQLRRTERSVSSPGALTGILAPLILRVISLIGELRARLSQKDTPARGLPQFWRRVAHSVTFLPMAPRAERSRLARQGSIWLAARRAMI